jgi:hypothetical protein
VEGDPDKVTVLWDSGPVVGGPVYKAAPDFEWKLDVNIVQIKLEDMSLTPGTAAGVGPMCKGQEMEALVASTSATTGVGITAKAKVTITGPTVDGVQRGVRYMEVGFLQISTSRDQFNISAKQDDNPIKILHYLENDVRYLDQITKNCAGQTLNTQWPWYDGTGLGGVGFFEGTTELQEVTKNMEVQDTPWMPVLTQNFTYDNKSWSPTRMDVRWNFELNIAARTRDGDVAQEERKNFTQLAQGVWRWDGDAKLDATAKWVADNAAVTKVNDLADTVNGALVKWNEEPLNTYIYPWLKDDGTPFSKHKVQ